MPNPVAVNPIDHKTLRVLETRSVAAGDGLMSCVTFPDEFRHVQSHYPILFQLDKDRSRFFCLALFGLESGENLFLKDGRWDARYVPLAMQVRPFMIGLPQQEGSDRKVVLDLDNPRVAEGEGQRLFDDFGQATDYLEGISQKLNTLDQGFQKSAEFTQTLRALDLLEPLTLDISTGDGSDYRLMGFHVIHEEKLAALDAASLKSLQEKGYLQAVYMAVASLSNLADLVDRKQDRGVDLA